MGGSERKVPPIVGDIPNRPRQVASPRESSNSGRGAAVISSELHRPRAGSLVVS